MHALESVAQLIQFDFDSVSYAIRGVPLLIEDSPRFAWRELMVDTSRHFLPIPVLRVVVDSMVTCWVSGVPEGRKRMSGVRT